MKLHQIPQRNNRTLKAKRLGRGYGSGKGGHTVGKGQKGQSSRTGGAKGKGFEGGNRPLYLRLPKFRGFRNPNSVVYQPVNLADLEKNFESGDSVSIKTLKEKGMVPKRMSLVKILSKGKLTKKLIVERGVKVSSNAQKAIETLGGSVGVK